MFLNYTNKEIRAIKVMRDYLMKDGRMPSVRELMTEMEYKSPRSASIIIDNLLGHGVLKKKLDGTLQMVQYEISSDTENRAQTVQVPLLGTVACGTPIFAEENVEAMFSVSTRLAKGPSKYFLLKAEGDSMDEKGINSGDMILVRQQDTATHGDIVVALIDDEATVKELRVLMPRSSNKSHSPIILAKDFMIQGIVISTIPAFD
jgi:repressor LexA